MPASSENQLPSNRGHRAAGDRGAGQTRAIQFGQTGTQHRENDDPYSPPGADHSIHPASDSGPVSADVIGSLVATQRWVRAMSVLHMLGSGVLVLMSLAKITTAAMANPTSFLASPGNYWLGTIFMIAAVLSAFQSFKLWRFANSLGRLNQSVSQEILVAALDRQRACWKLAGLTGITLLVGALVACGIAAKVF